MAKGRKTGGGSRKGRPNRGAQEVKDLVDAIFARVDPVDKAVQLLKSASDKTQGAVLLRLLEYRYGKPVQPIAGTGEDGSIRVIVEHIASHSITA